MKRLIKILVFTVILSIPALLAAQLPPHPNGGGGPGGGNVPVGGGAPLDGGISIMLALASLYGSMKVLKTQFRD